MLNQLKDDRIAQLILAGVILAGLVTCAVFAYGGYVYLSRQPPAAPVITLTPVVYSFNGSGDGLEFFEASTAGRALVGLGHRGDRNFIVNIVDGDGFIIEQVVNEIGEYDGEKAIHLEPGRYTIEVTADGPWMVVILPPQ